MIGGRVGLLGIGALTGIAIGASLAEPARSAYRFGARLVAVAGAGALAATLGAAWAVPLALAAVVLIGARRGSLAFTIPAAGVAAAAAVWAAGRVDAAAALASLPAPGIDALAGLFLGAVSSAAFAARHVGLERDPVRAAQRALPALSGEPKALVDRAMAIWAESATMAPDDRALVASGVTTVFTVAARAAAAPAIDTAAIDARIVELDQRIAACTDEIAATQYREARAALADQASYAASVGAARERIVARMHHCVATLEKFRLAGAHADATAAAREAADARSAVAVLADMSDGLASVATLTDGSAAPATAS